MQITAASTTASRTPNDRSLSEERLEPGRYALHSIATASPSAARNAAASTGAMHETMSETRANSPSGTDEPRERCARATLEYVIVKTETNRIVMPALSANAATSIPTKRNGDRILPAASTTSDAETEKENRTLADIRQAKDRSMRKAPTRPSSPIERGPIDIAAPSVGRTILKAATNAIAGNRGIAARATTLAPIPEAMMHAVVTPRRATRTEVLETMQTTADTAKKETTSTQGSSSRKKRGFLRPKGKADERDHGSKRSCECDLFFFLPKNVKEKGNFEIKTDGIVECRNDGRRPAKNRLAGFLLGSRARNAPSASMPVTKPVAQPTKPRTGKSANTAEAERKTAATQTWAKLCRTAESMAAGMMPARKTLKTTAIPAKAQAVPANE